MGDTIKYISKIEIHGLWGKFDLEWNLQPDVNVLSGINGSGKTTVLNCVLNLLRSNDQMRNNELFNGNRSKIDEIGKLISSCKISFDNGLFILFEFVKKNEANLSLNKMEDYDTSLYFGINNDVYITQLINQHNIDRFLQIDFISTFDNELKPYEAIIKVSDSNVETYLDFEIYHLQKKYLDYQINIGKRAFEAISKNNSNGDVIKVKETQEKFLGLVDSLFESTGKRINRTENEITFLSGEEKLTAYQLSSGEKQLLVILLTVLVQDNKNAILFMDEPEISLHFDWQKKLIGYIRELNPNVQIILATHAPAIIREGWMDKVSNIVDLIKPETKS